MLIPPRIACLSKLCDTEATRYALFGVQFSRDENSVPRAVVTNGRVLVETTWTEDGLCDYPPAAGINVEPKPGFETIIPKDQLNAAAKLPPKRMPSNKAVLLNIALDEQNANGTIPVAGYDLENVKRMDIKPAEGRFPKWQDVMVQYEPVKQWQVIENNLSNKCVSIHVDAKYLAKVLEVVLASGNSDNDEFSTVELLVPLNRERPIVVKRERSTGIVMPLGGDYGDNHKPEEDQ
jgi:hypothetical protein